MYRLEMIKENLENDVPVEKEEIQWLVSKFEELQEYTRKTRGRWVEVNNRNIELEKNQP